MSTPDELDVKINQMTNQDKNYLVKLIKKANRRSKAKWFLAGAATTLAWIFIPLPHAKDSETTTTSEPDPE